MHIEGEIDESVPKKKNCQKRQRFLNDQKHKKKKELKEWERTRR